MKSSDDKWIDALRVATQLDEPAPGKSDEALEAALVELCGDVAPMDRERRRTRNPGAVANRAVRAFRMGAMTAAVVGVVLFLFFRNDIGSPVTGSEDVLTESGGRQMMSELETLFDGQFVAVVLEGDGMDIQLAERSASSSHWQRLPPADQRVCLVLDDAGRRITVLGYSGRSVSVSVGGQSLALMPLVNVEGEVIVVSKNAVFDGDKKHLIDGLKVVDTRRLSRGLQNGGIERS